MQRVNHRQLGALVVKNNVLSKLSSQSYFACVPFENKAKVKYFLDAKTFKIAFV
jgi:hypothetical protein